jgi:tetratricopeptide (TPR) repeat protein
MRCLNCNLDGILPGSAICPQCGTDLLKVMRAEPTIQLPPQAQPQQVPLANSPPHPQNQPQKQNQTWMMVLFLAVGGAGIVALGLAGLLLWVHSNSEQRAQPSAAVTPPATRPVNSTAVAHYDRGCDKYLKEDYKGAIRDIDKAIQLDPNYADAYQCRGLSYSALQDYKLAVKDYDKAIQLAPNVADSYFFRGNAYAGQEEYKLALRDYDKAIELKRKDGLVYLFRGVTRFELEDYQGALEDYNRSIRLQPGDAYAYSKRGDVKRKLKDKPGAILDYQESIRLYEAKGDQEGAKSVRDALRELQG